MTSTGNDPNVMTEGAAPTPFTAAEIRDNCPPGRTTHLRVASKGEPAVITITRFVSRDSEGGVQESWMTDEDGSLLGEVSRTPFKWTDLQAHASFPAATTSVGAETIDTELGTFDCQRYIVTRDDGVSTFWFANDLPGMPILFTTVRNGETIVTATLVVNEMP